MCDWGCKLRMPRLAGHEVPPSVVMGIYPVYSHSLHTSKASPGGETLCRDNLCIGNTNVANKYVGILISRILESRWGKQVLSPLVPGR